VIGNEKKKMKKLVCGRCTTIHGVITIPSTIHYNQDNDVDDDDDNEEGDDDYVITVIGSEHRRPLLPPRP
jgi:hypothetical protein